MTTNAFANLSLYTRVLSQICLDDFAFHSSKTLYLSEYIYTIVLYSTILLCRVSFNDSVHKFHCNMTERANTSH